MHLQPAAFGVGGLAQGGAGGPGRLIEGVGGVVRPDTGHLAGPHKAGNVVDVAVGLAGVNAVLEPDHLVHIQILFQLLLDLALGHVGVAPRAQKAHLGGEQGAFPVHVDGAALQHKAGRVVAVHTFDLADLAGHGVVVGPGKIAPVHKAAPGVELPVHRAHRALVVGQKGGAAVPAPGVVGAHLHHPHLVGQLGAGVGVLGGGDQHGHRLKGADGPGHVGIGFLGGLCAVAPVVRPLGPDHPDLFLGLVLAGHAEAVLPRCALNALCHRRFFAPFAPRAGSFCYFITGAAPGTRANRRRKNFFQKGACFLARAVVE